MGKYTYISLFSSAGVGCYGFKQEKFECIATNELLEKRLKIQEYNRKCKYKTGYIAGDITLPKNHKRIFEEIEKWNKQEKIKEVDVFIATPPCQGMSVANHKKKNEQNRNSLIVESIKLVKEIHPKYFIFENVKAFLNTICINLNGEAMPIRQAIDLNLAGNYNILKQIINFKEYGSNSSRTRTLVIGIRKDIKDITPYDIFPKQEKEKTLKQIIGQYPKLKNMGDIDSSDIYHHFRKYDERMLAWIKDLPQGKSAFDNTKPTTRPHKIVNGKIIYNQNKNGDKYKRCEWDKSAPCIHTRNDIMSSQLTLHPIDNRVFSIRELMTMMTIPKSFLWVSQDLKVLNSLSLKEKEAFLKKETMNIRQSIGEAVPTIIFRKIANNIVDIEKKTLSNREIKNLVSKKKLANNYLGLCDFVSEYKNLLPYNSISRIIELANINRNIHAAFYTPQSICYSLVKELPEFKQNTIRILEPSAGIGNFIPLLARKYYDKNVIIDVVDLDNNILELLKLLQKNYFTNIKLNFINADFLAYSLLNSSNIKNKYDLVIGNPPFGKVIDKVLLKEYRINSYNKKTSNLFAFFLEKALKTAKYVAMITPKSLLASPEFNQTRKFIENNTQIKTIIDYGEKGFEGVKIETISIVIENIKVKPKEYEIKIESYITKQKSYIKNTDLFDRDFNSWLIYKNDFFRKTKKKMYFSIFDFYRDRAITKKHTLSKGKVRVLKSRNIQNNRINNIKNYDCFINDFSDFSVKKYLNSKAILIPNLSYNPRACFLPKNSITDGSVAILQPKNGFFVTEEDLEYYATEEFRKFYMIGRNLGTRSLNIDSNSVNLWGIKKEKHINEYKHY